MTDDQKTILGWGLGALGFLALLIVLTFAIPGLRKAPVMMAGKKAAPKDFFTTDQMKVLFPVSSSKYDPTNPPKEFVLSKAQKDALIAAGYDACVKTDGFGDQEQLMGCFCENAPAARAILDPSVGILQPWNTWSAIFGFTPFGILIMIILIWQAAGNQPPQDNLMVNNYFYSLFYAYLAIFLGPASAMFHIGLRNYGGWFDSFSIHLLFGFTLVYNLTRMWMDRGGWISKSFLGLNAQRWLFLIFFIVSTVIVEIICSPPVAPDMRFWFDLIIGGLALIIQGLVFWARSWHHVAPGGGWWFIAAFIAFGAAVFIWAMSWTACPWCLPRGFQGHAVWHLLCGLGAFFLYMYFRREGEPKDVVINS